MNCRIESRHVLRPRYPRAVGERSEDLRLFERVVLFLAKAVIRLTVMLGLLRLRNTGGGVIRASNRLLATLGLQVLSFCASGLGAGICGQRRLFDEAGSSEASGNWRGRDHRSSVPLSRSV